MHFLSVSILKIKILLFLKLFGTFFMKFLCYVDLLRSLTNLIVNSGGKWVKHPNRPYPPTPPIAKFQLSILLSKRLYIYQNFGQVGVQVSCLHSIENFFFLYILG